MINSSTLCEGDAFWNIVISPVTNVILYEVENVYTYFPKCLAKILRKAVVQNRICYTQISVCQHMTENLYGNS